MKKEHNSKVEELVQNGVLAVDNSLVNPSFDLKGFYQVYSELNLPPRPDNVVIAKNGLLDFFTGNRHGYILFGLRDIKENTFKAVASFKTHKFEMAAVLVRSNEEDYIVKDFNQLVRDRLGLDYKPCYFLEFSGCVVRKDYRGRGYASLLTELRYKTVIDAINSGGLTFLDGDSKDKIDPKKIVTMSVARGDLQGDQNLERLKQDFGQIGTNIPNDLVISCGLELQKLGVARSISVATQKIAEKRGMKYAGINLTDGGPVYVLPLLQK